MKMTTKRQLQNRWSSGIGLELKNWICDFLRPLQVGHGKVSDPIFSMLEGLPFRDEVTSGRDFRGSDFMEGWELDFTDADFSYSPILGSFVRADLSRSRFDESRKDSGQFGSCLLDQTSFKKCRFRRTGFVRCIARNASFENATLLNPRFDFADLRGACFRGANLKGAVFFGAKLQGCDFRGANLQDASLYGVEVDENTDLRGTNLINASVADRYNNAGNLLGHALDLKIVKTDAATRLGSDPRLEALEVLNAALFVSNDRSDVESMRVRQAVQLVLTDIEKQYFDDWFDRVLSYLAPEERAAHEEIMEDAYRSLR
jgi:uncharacterized protein YjbI with pentapeptide repeats